MAFLVCLVAVRSTVAMAPTAAPMQSNWISRSRFAVFAGILATPVVYGFVLWMLDLGLAGDIGSQSGSQVALYDRLRTWCGIAFAWTAVVTVGTQSLVAARRWQQYTGSEFGRVQPLLVIPELAALFALILVFLIFGTIRGALAGGSMTEAAVNEAVFRLLVFCLGVVAIPVGLSISNRVTDLRGRGFLHALLRAELGVVVLLLAFAWAYLSVTGLGS